MPIDGDLLSHFTPQERETLLGQAARYGELVEALPGVAEDTEPTETGILALNGASGAGQSYVLEAVERLLQAAGVTLPRIHLLGTRAPRPGEGHKDPYVFVERVEGGYRDVHHPEVVYPDADVYTSYSSRPGADNAILLEDMQAASERVMYLETVIPTLLHMRDDEIAGLPPWGDRLRIVYLAAPSGDEWVGRLLGRQPARLVEPAFRVRILGRTTSSLADLELAASHAVPCVLNHHGRGDEAAREILAAWGLSGYFEQRTR